MNDRWRKILNLMERYGLIQFFRSLLFSSFAYIPFKRKVINLTFLLFGKNLISILEMMIKIEISFFQSFVGHDQKKEK